MKRTIAAVALVLAILAVGYWGMAGWWQEKRELSALQVNMKVPGSCNRRCWRKKRRWRAS